MAKKRAEGYRRVDRPEGIVELATDVHRHPELEAQVAAAAPGDAAPYLVYADWLQQRGDPRGELITLAHAMHAQSDPREFMAFKQREQALRFAHERAWLGELAVACAHRLKLDWRLGFVERARIAATTNPSEPSMPAVLGALLAAPAGCAVRSLELVADQGSRVEEIIAACALLPVPGLRALRCDSRSGMEEASREAFAPHRARLSAAGVAIDESLF